MPSVRAEVTAATAPHQRCSASLEKKDEKTVSAGAAISITESKDSGSGDAPRLMARSMTRACSCQTVWLGSTLLAVTRRTISITVTTRKRELDSARGWLVYAS